MSTSRPTTPTSPVIHGHRRTSRGMCKVTFRVKAEVPQGETVVISGNHLALGSFFQAVQLQTSSETYPYWTTKHPVTVPMNVPLEYKYSVFSGGRLSYWEDIEGDREVTPTERRCTYSDTFGIYSRKAPKAGAHTRTRSSRSIGSRSGRSRGTKAGPRKAASMFPLQRTLGSGQIVFVMNSLPVILTKNAEGKWESRWDKDNFRSRSSPSIADTVRSFWVGLITRRCFRSTTMPTLTEDDKKQIIEVTTAQGCLPVILDNDTLERHTRYCCSVLWPALHNVTESGEPQQFDTIPVLELEEHFAAYMAVNHALAVRVASKLRKQDLVWIHGYQCFLVPKLIEDASKRRPAMCFWFHSPFPTSEVFRCLSHRDELLFGLLACDIVGFHAFNHARHFMTSCKRQLGLRFQSRQNGRMGVDYHGREVMINISHVNVRTNHVKTAMRSEEAARVSRELRERHAGKVILGGIDDCSRLSGVFMKILALRHLLNEYDYIGKVVLVQRMDMDQDRHKDAAKSSSEIRKFVAEMNTKFGVVVDYEESYRYSSEYRVGLYHAADILFHSPIREGVNLMPLEYIYCRGEWQSQVELARDTASTVVHTPEASESKDSLAPPRRGGTLVLSEFATASHVTSAHMSINPWNVKDVAATIDQAVQLSAKEVQNRQRKDYFRIAGAPMISWTQGVLLDLLKTRESRDNSHFTEMEAGDAPVHSRRYKVGAEAGADLCIADPSEVAAAYAAANHRVVFLDYGGTLFSREGVGRAYKHEFLGFGVKLSKERLAVIKALSEDPKTTLFVVTGTALPNIGGIRDISTVGLAVQNGLSYSWGTSRSHAKADDTTVTTTAAHPAGSMVADADPTAREWVHNRIADPVQWSFVKERAKQVMERYAHRINGSIIREYTALVALDYRNADPEWAQAQAKFLLAELRDALSTSRSFVKVCNRKTRVEVSLSAINKGQLVRQVLAAVPDADFVLALGDDTSDEDMFLMVHALLSVDAHEAEDAAAAAAAAKTAPAPTAGAAAAAGEADSGAGATTGGAAVTPVTGLARTPSTADVPTATAATPPLGPQDARPRLDGAAAAVGDVAMVPPSPYTTARAIKQSRAAGQLTLESEQEDGPAVEEGEFDTLDAKIVTDDADTNLPNTVGDIPTLASAFAITVGRKRTRARFFVHNVDEVHGLLRVMAKTLPGVELPPSPTPDRATGAGAGAATGAGAGSGAGAGAGAGGGADGASTPGVASPATGPLMRSPERVRMATKSAASPPRMTDA